MQATHIRCIVDPFIMFDVNHLAYVSSTPVVLPVKDFNRTIIKMVSLKVMQCQHSEVCLVFIYNIAVISVLPASFF